MVEYQPDNLKELGAEHLKVLRNFYEKQLSRYEELWQEANRLIEEKALNLTSETTIIGEDEE